MEIKIVKKTIKENNNRYYLELTLSENIDYLWEESFKDALKTNSYTSLRGTGAPVINKISFDSDKIITPSFPEFAQHDLPDFIQELEQFINIANSIYKSKLEIARQKQEQEKRIQEEKQQKLDEMNKKLNS